MKSGNKKHNVRIAALIAAVLALCLALTGCMMGSGKQPSINAEDDSTVAYADRQLTLRKCAVDSGERQHSGRILLL